MSAIEAKSIERLRRHTEALAARRIGDDPVIRRLHVAKRITWMVLLAGAFIFFYLIDKMQEALSILG